MQQVGILVLMSTGQKEFHMSHPKRNSAGFEHSRKNMDGTSFSDKPFQKLKSLQTGHASAASSDKTMLLTTLRTAPYILAAKNILKCEGVATIIFVFANNNR